MSKKILIVDDEAMYAKGLSVALEKEGYETESAQNGREALGAYLKSMHDSSPIALILLDIKLPAMSGLEVLDLIRKDEKDRGVSEKDGIPVILFTAYDQPWIDPKLMQGNTDFIVKSFDDTELLQKIDRKLKESGGFAL